MRSSGSYGITHFISQTLIVVPAKAGTQRSSQDPGFRLFAALRPERRE
jgi:hypothetical protein